MVLEQNERTIDRKWLHGAPVTGPVKTARRENHVNDDDELRPTTASDLDLDGENGKRRQQHAPTNEEKHHQHDGRQHDEQVVAPPLHAGLPAGIP